VPFRGDLTCSAGESTILPPGGVVCVTRVTAVPRGLIQSIRPASWDRTLSGKLVSGLLVPPNATAANTIIFVKWTGLHEAYHGKIAAHPHYQGSEPSPQPSHRTILSQLLRLSTMDARSRQPKERDNTVSALNAAIEALNLAKEVSSIPLAKAVFGTVSVILTTIKASFFMSPVD